MGFRRAELALVGTGASLVFSRVFGLSLVLPVFRDHYEGTLGFDALWVGLALGAHGLSMALMQLPMGLLSDRIGRRPALLMASLMFVVGSLVAAFAASEMMLVAGRFLQGLGAVASVAMAAIGESVPRERRTQAMALIGIPAGLGFMVGMGVGPVLYPFIGMRGLFLVVAAIGLLAAVPLPVVRFAAPHERPAPEGKALSLPVIGLMTAGFALNFFLYTTLFFLPTSDWRSLVPMLVIALVVMGGATRIIDRSGLTWQPAAVGLIGLAASAPWFALTAGWVSFAGGAVFFSLHATLSAVLPSQVSRLAGAAGGRGHGAQNIIAHGGTFTAGAAAGALAGVPLWAFAAAATIGLMASLFLALRGHAVDESATPAGS